MAGASSAGSDPQWQSFQIPDSAPAIEMARLRREDDGAFTVLVRFPVGWERPVTGSYDAAEEALVLEGELTMSGRVHGPGSFARWGVGYERAGTSTPGGATVLAWFSGPNRWTAGPTGTTQLEADVLAADAEPVALGDLPPARVLSDRPDASVLWWDAAPVAARVSCDLDLFSVDDRRFVHVTADTPVPDLTGPVLVRLRGHVDQLT